MARTFQGDVTFLLHEKESPHRFELSVTEENKIAIWLEDRRSKKQWHTDPLGTIDFVNEDNAIPKAKIADYAERFAACLSSTDTSVEYERALVTKGGERVLILTLPLLWAAHDLSVEYKFPMKEVPLERIDILGARMRDVEDKLASVDEERIRRLEDENRTLKSEIKRLGELATKEPKENNRVAAYTHAATTSRHSANQKLDCVDIGVIHSSAHNGVIFELKQSDTSLVTSHGSSYEGYYSMSSLRYVLPVEANDDIHVLYRAHGYCEPGSYITIIKL